MRLAAILCLTLCTPCMAQEPVIALDAEDAATCATGCTMITPAALKAIAERLHRAEELEAIAQQLARELKRKPDPKYCL